MIIQNISLIGKRKSNEDTVDYNEDEEKIFFGLFDGHGGKHVSNYLKKNLGKYFINKKVTSSYIKKVYEKVNNKLLEHSYAKECGSTALVALLFKNEKKKYLKLINLGDCRAILGNKYDMAIQLTIDHKPDYYKERERIKKMGRKPTFDDEDNNWRIDGYSLSRAFGDTNYKTISSEPDVYNYMLSSKDKFLIFACDGLWDVVSNQEAVNFVNKYISNEKFKLRKINSNSKNNVAHLLGKYAIEKGSFDNITITIVFFDN